MSDASNVTEELLAATAKIAELEATVADLFASVDIFFVLIMGIICFLLQAGFGLLEAGSIRAKNSQNIMIKNIMDAVVTAIAYYAFGYTIAYGKFKSSGKAQTPDCGVSSLSNTWIFLVLQELTVTTPLSGALRSCS